MSLWAVVAVFLAVLAYPFVADAVVGFLSRRRKR